MSAREEEVQALKDHLDEELRQFRERCQADSRRHFIVALNSLEKTIEEGNLAAEKFYKNELARAKDFPRMRERLERMAAETYKRTHALHENMLAAFIRDCDPTVRAT